MSRPQWGLLADDLTGACDAGVQFAQRGFCSVVSLGEPGAGESCDLVARTSDSRNDPAHVARSKVDAVCGLFVHESRGLIYKKIDSTLRGNVGAEIEATMIKCSFSLAVISPGFPAMGRTMEGGVLATAGAPGRAVHLPTLLCEQGLERVHHLGRSALRTRVGGLTERIQELAATRPAVVVVDAVSQEDLALIADAALKMGPAALPIGSAGLAAEVAGILAARLGERPAKAPNDATRKETPVVLFIGSNDPVTRAQVEFLLSSGLVVYAEARDLTSDALCSALRRERHLVLAVDLADQKSRLPELCQGLAEFRPSGVVFSGGDTAHLVCRELGVTGIRLERELSPGLPWGYLMGGLANGWPVVTKAGGFGAENALTTAVDFLCPRNVLKETGR